ncbi:2-hydroxy-3-oxopropionate reductase [Serratia liquefaciens]|jgi:3-hydroxyisobutyrate dehydrogenase-like beta-hydroxyacid dehydrogenase|uniref:NAD(P)-dependent oxidoreductase n=1 Tax=Serratia TaxID=613 RepID=UPI002117F67D|nr:MULTISPECIES: NAD(P)-dependent oxidoreductase [Serratia]CAI0750508.1 2-hydroxy-3-oxopropionate reductase [Serratia liquefaciens]CAI0754245.1 2-hydroxy-3-oxopropionate reductase [Serratia liquefaciens]CAI0954559.1 2-hydroxy-3-oxopropionate reductase [Serratia liquefaciens]CAI1771810.1 2-hydroxy-3-oxopropionate reductase [Serratia liquefaciens]
MKIGFAGLGGMGSAMAANLLQAGYGVKVWNRSPQAAQPLVSAGAVQARQPEELAEVDVLITMLANDAATEQVVVESGLLQQLRAGAIHINMATVSVALAKRLALLHAERNVGYIAAPVLGRVDVAAAGKLNILAAGDPLLLAKVQPLFEVLGQQTWHFGDEPEQANIVKIAANFTLASAIEAMAEGSALVRNYGVSGADYLHMLTSTLFASPAYKGYGGLIAEEKFEPAGFKLSLGMKDVGLALEAGANSHTPMPFASVLKDNFLDAVAQGDADLDWSALAKVAARRAGLK